MILFQPCPHHFPDLWRIEVPTLPELDAWQIQAGFFRTSHGFLVEDGHLLLEYEYGIYGLDALEFLKGEGLPLQEACFERARRFSLPDTYPRLGWPAGIGRDHTNRTVCLPCAKATWPPLK